MNQYEFLNYTATPTEKHLGIVTIRAWGKIILRYKLVPNKDGTGFFIGCASYKLPNAISGGDEYKEAFLLDSNYESKELDTFLRSHLKNAMSKPASVFDRQQGSVMPSNSYNNILNSPPSSLSEKTEELPF